MKTYRDENDRNDNDIETVEKNLVQTLSMEGNFDNRGQRWVNLTDYNGHKDDQVDRNTLIFLQKLVPPITKEKEINEDNSSGWQTRLHLKLLYFKRKCHSLCTQGISVSFHQVVIFLAIVVIVVAVLFHLVAKDLANNAKS
jgi:hypothetical protein